MNSTSRRTERGSLSLASAIAEFLAAERYYLRPSTIATYRSHLDAFAAAHDGATVRDLRVTVVRAHVNQLLRSGKRYAARNRCIALRALSRYLATELGLPARDRPVLEGVRIPPVPRLGRAPYQLAEVLALWDGIRRSPLRSRALWSAVFWLLLGTGIRSSEARALLRRDVQLSGSFIRHVTVSGADGKSAAATREVPLDPPAEGAIRGYLLGRRFAWGDRDGEPLFLTEDGVGFSADGWPRCCSGCAARSHTAAGRRINRIGCATRGLAMSSRPVSRRSRSCKWPDGPMPTCFVGTSERSACRSSSGTRPPSRSTRRDVREACISRR